MATRPSTKKSAASKEAGVGLPVIIAAVVLLVVLLGGLAYHYLGPQQGGGTGHVRALTADEQWVQQKAQETGGDYNKLTQEEQRRLFSLYGPKAPFDFKQQAHSTKVGP